MDIGKEEVRAYLKSPVQETTNKVAVAEAITKGKGEATKEGSLREVVGTKTEAASMGATKEEEAGGGRAETNLVACLLRVLALSNLKGGKDSEVVDLFWQVKASVVAAFTKFAIRHYPHWRYAGLLPAHSLAFHSHVHLLLPQKFFNAAMPSSLLLFSCLTR
jgi:hypothetical protein